MAEDWFRDDLLVIVILFLVLGMVFDTIFPVREIIPGVTRTTAVRTLTRPAA